MTTALVILLCAALLIAGLEWIRANGEQERADVEQWRAEQAESFAGDCVAVMAPLRAGRIVTRTAAGDVRRLGAEWAEWSL